MEFFNGLFGRNKNQEEKAVGKIAWIPITSLVEVDKIEEKSEIRPQVIFKHSTTCGISRMVLNMFSANYRIEEGHMDMYFLDLHKHRDVSDEISRKFGVTHQSPQLLIIKEGAVVAHKSHGAITEIDLEPYVSLEERQ
ncbi:bacillithiol system redox-active protein YtxJ [Pareuzebyella sediminis]|uniref:bacillithiol system redox-active protein YtxJ n=1 Tax=Pareuzebyella sediminis TaxID=2607998 RepID=UPI0011EC1031|nr:bacillithiol system redox-active protein YtxJ [Pareuzebyella sediminis]